MSAYDGHNQHIPSAAHAVACQFDGVPGMVSWLESDVHRVAENIFQLPAELLRRPGSIPVLSGLKIMTIYAKVLAEVIAAPDLRWFEL
ncbi:hypothetical protein GCM10023063_21300 [Arthrobacter methylotrophus]|uniref:Uncharacterized protein n=1 Tax=Arthrobacter methylotrophus TaxID=121291 RepID=A0ABV5UTQ2_9MICC